jgi:hypothetical protein
MGFLMRISVLLSMVIQAPSSDTSVCEKKVACGGSSLLGPASHEGSLRWPHGDQEGEEEGSAEVHQQEAQREGQADREARKTEREEAQRQEAEGREEAGREEAGCEESEDREEGGCDDGQRQEAEGCEEAGCEEGEGSGKEAESERASEVIGAAGGSPRPPRPSLRSISPIPRREPRR